MSRRSTTGADPETRPARTATRGVGRREFCRLGALLGGCAIGTLAASRAGLAIGPGRPDFADQDTIFRSDYPIDAPDSVVLSTCLGCHGACPVRVATEGGVLAKSDGNPWSPRVRGGPLPSSTDEAATLRGASCARGQARLQNTHDPFRIVRPLSSDGQRGAGNWRTLLADDAEAAVTSALAPTRPAGLVVAVDPRQLDRRPVLEAFGESLEGAEVHLGTPSPWITEASRTMIGQPGWELRPRFARACGALIWGADSVASGVDPVGDARDLLNLRERHGNGGLVVVDPRLSEVAGMADTWLPVRPGGDMALAWMLLRAWVDSGAVTPPDVWQQQLHARPWKDLEPRAGLGEMVVRRTADRLAEMGGGLAIRVGGGVGERPGGAEVCEAILRLAVVSGATDVGGAMEPVQAPVPLGERPDVALHRLLAGGAVIDRLLVVGDGGITDGPHHGDLLAALADPQRVQNLVVVTTVMNPVAALADVIVPDVTEHERFGLVERWDGISLVQPSVHSVMADVGVEAPWSRGLEGLLETLCGHADSALDSHAAVEGAIAATPSPVRLQHRGWLAPAKSAAEPPLPDAFRAQAIRSPGDPIAGVALVTYRESFGGFVDSTAQYWATPSLRSDNEAWIHPTTFDEIGGDRGHRVELEVGEVRRELNVVETEAVRPGVIAAAVGYGHTEGFDGRMTIDGVTVQPDPRRELGTDVGALRDSAGAVAVHPADPEPRRTLVELLASKTGSCDRL